MRRQALLALGFGVAVAALIACNRPAEEASDGSGSAIIGGVDAKSAALDAIGALMLQDPATGQIQLLCTATLIGPRTILTAKHCAVQNQQVPSADPDAGGGVQNVETRFIDQGKMFFGVGFDSNQTKQLLPLESVQTCNVGSGGFMGLGCDMSVYTLAAPVTNIKPLKVATKSLVKSAVGKPFTAVGYGFQTQDGSQLGTRKAGTLTLRAVSGPPLAAIFKTADDFLDALRDSEGNDFVTTNEAAYREIYGKSLLEGYEAYAGAGENDAQVCSGDSGGPLLAQVGGELVVQGVASGVVSGARQACQLGSTYGILGPKALDLINRSLNDPCKDLPAEGRCEGAVAVRCTTAAEGQHKVTRTDCGALFQRCVLAPAESPDAGPVDVDGGAPDPDGGFTAPARTVECAD